MAKARATRAKTEAKAARKRRKKLMALAAGAAVLAVGALVLIGTVLRGNDKVVSVDITSQRQGRLLGDETAGVLITMWEDFQCPNCKQASQNLIPTIIRDYVNTGKAQIAFRYFALWDPESTWAAEAAECSAEQGKFWEYEAELFKRQGAENSGVFTKAKLKQYATGVGLDAEPFNTCLDTDRYKSDVQAEKKEGEGLGVSSTPTFFIDGKQVPNWTDTAAVRTMIDNALKGR